MEGNPVAENIAGAVELLLVVAGLAVSWRAVIRPALRGEAAGPSLPRWEIPPSGFILFLMCVLVGGASLPALVLRISAHFRPSLDTVTIIGNAALHLGMLLGIAAFSQWGRFRRAQVPSPAAGALRSGVATFLIVLPPMTAALLAGQALMDLLKLPEQEQDLIELFTRTHDPVLRGLLVVLAVVVAPVTEELIFRAGIFRYLRGRAPRWIALGAPALLFGALHVDWKSLAGLIAVLPLVILALVFSLAYERTGRIQTTIVAHALFNLNTVIALLAGLK